MKVPSIVSVIFALLYTALNIVQITELSQKGKDYTNSILSLVLYYVEGLVISIVMMLVMTITKSRDFSQFVILVLMFVIPVTLVYFQYSYWTEMKDDEDRIIPYLEIILGGLGMIILLVRAVNFPKYMHIVNTMHAKWVAPTKSVRKKPRAKKQIVKKSNVKKPDYGMYIDNFLNRMRGALNI